MVLRIGNRRLSVSISLENGDLAVVKNPLPGADDCELIQYSRGPAQDIERARWEGLGLLYGRGRGM